MHFINYVFFADRRSLFFTIFYVFQFFFYSCPNSVSEVHRRSSVNMIEVFVVSSFCIYLSYIFVLQPISIYTTIRTKCANFDNYAFLCKAKVLLKKRTGLKTLAID